MAFKRSGDEWSTRNGKVSVGMWRRRSQGRSGKTEVIMNDLSHMMISILTIRLSFACYIIQRNCYDQWSHHHASVCARGNIQLSIGQLY